jgi:transcription factor CON7
LLHHFGCQLYFKVYHADGNVLFTEFKEIRKEWKAKKKEEEAQRKADEERQRATDGRNATEHASDNPAYGNMRSQMPPSQMGGPQLPPIGYAPASGGQGAQYGTQSPGTMEGMSQYGTQGHVYDDASSNGNHSYPQSPYGQNNPMYQQSK